MHFKYRLQLFDP